MSLPVSPKQRCVGFVSGHVFLDVPNDLPLSSSANAVSGSSVAEAQTRRYPLFHMQRLTARLLLIIVVIGVFQPLLEAFSAQPPHACCLRRLHSRDRSLHFSDATKPGGNCCPPLSTPNSARVVSRDLPSIISVLSIINLRPEADVHYSEFSSNLLARAPPVLFTANS